MTSRPSLRLATRTRRAAAAAFAVVLGVAVLPSSAAPSSRPSYPPLSPAAETSELPPASGFVLAGVVATTQVTVARQSKLAITIDEKNPILALLRYGRWNDPLEDPTGYNGAASYVPWPFGPIDCATVPVEEYPSVQYVPSDLTTFTVTPEGTLAEVGRLPSTRVNMLAFGSIPASVTINLSMTRDGGAITPWVQQLWQPHPATPGCEGGLAAYYYRSLVEGQADMTLSDLVIDGVPVDLGSSCRTQSPVKIALWGEEGYFALQGGTLGQYDGLASGTRVPLTSPYYFEQEGRMIPDSTGLDIPPFVGCGVGGDDLSDIVTAMASGPNNPVRVAQGSPTKEPYDPDNLLRCDTSGECPLPAPAPPSMPPLPDGEQP